MTEKKNEDASTTQGSDAAQKSAAELEREQQDRDEQAAFDVGYAETRGQEATPEAKETLKKAEEKAQAEASAGDDAAPAKGADKPQADGAAAAAATPVKDDWEGVHPQVRKVLESVQSQVGSIEHLAKSTAGRVGHLQSALDAGKQAASAAGGEQPSDKDIAMALADPQAWKAFEEEFPDFAKPVKAQFEAMHKALSARKAPAVDVEALKKDVMGSTSEAFSTAIAQAEERALVRMKHPEYRKTVNLPEFKAWFEVQPADMKARADSNAADDAIAMLDAYHTHVGAQREKAQKTADEKVKKQERLRAAAAPGGTGAPARGAQSEEEAFAEGYNAVRGARL